MVSPAAEETIMVSLSRIVQSIVAQECRKAIFLEVKGVVEKMNRADINTFVDLIDGAGPQVICVLWSYYNIYDPTWRWMAAHHCYWRRLVDHCSLCIFPDSMPSEGETLQDVRDKALYKDHDMPEKFWYYDGSISQVINAMPFPCLLFSFASFRLSGCHWMGWLREPPHNILKQMRAMLTPFLLHSLEAELWDVCFDLQGGVFYINPNNHAEAIRPHVTNDSWETYVWKGDIWFFHPQSRRSVIPRWRVRALWP